MRFSKRILCRSLRRGFLALLLMGAVPAVASPQRVENPTVSGGGGTMSAGKFSVTTTLGESIAGTIESPPADRVVAGFWGAASAGFEGGPGGAMEFVSIEVLDGAPVTVRLRFQGSAGARVEVQSSPAIDGPWTRVGTVTLSGLGAGVYSDVLTVESTFYRLAR